MYLISSFVQSTLTLKYSAFFCLINLLLFAILIAVAVVVA